MANLAMAWRRGGAVGAEASLYRTGCVFSTPGTRTQYWHCDGSHRGTLTADFSAYAAGGEGARVAPATSHSCPPAAVCVFLPLIDLTDTTGYTTFWPGTHVQDDSDLLACDFPSQHSWATLRALAQAGDAILYDFRVLHRGSQITACCDRLLISWRPHYEESKLAAGSLEEAVDRCGVATALDT